MANNVLFYKQTDALEAYMYYLYGHCFEARLVIVHVGDSINRSNFHDMRSSVINRCRCNKLLTVLFLFGHFGSLCIYTSVYLDISVPYVFIPLCIWTFRFLMYLYLCEACLQGPLYGTCIRVVHLVTLMHVSPPLKESCRGGGSTKSAFYSVHSYLKMMLIPVLETKNSRVNICFLSNKSFLSTEQAIKSA